MYQELTVSVLAHHLSSYTLSRDSTKETDPFEFPLGSPFSQSRDFPPVVV